MWCRLFEHHRLVLFTPAATARINSTGRAISGANFSRIRFGPTHRQALNSDAIYVSGQVSIRTASPLPRIPGCGHAANVPAVQCLEGGIVLSRILRDPRAVGNQILHYRDYLRLLYDADNLHAAAGDTKLN